MIGSCELVSIIFFGLLIRSCGNVFFLCQFVDKSLSKILAVICICVHFSWVNCYISLNQQLVEKKIILLSGECTQAVKRDMFNFREKVDSCALFIHSHTQKKIQKYFLKAKTTDLSLPFLRRVLRIIVFWYRFSVRGGVNTIIFHCRWDTSF